MKRISLMMVISFIICIVVGCNNDSTEIVQLKETISNLENELKTSKENITDYENQSMLHIEKINSLQEENNELSMKVDDLKSKLALSSGYAGQYMFDLLEVYDSLNCPIILEDNQDIIDLMNRLIIELTSSEEFSDKKVIYLKNNMDDTETNYVFEVLVFSPVDNDSLMDLMESNESPPFPSIRLYSISVTLKDDELIYEVN